MENKNLSNEESCSRLASNDLFDGAIIVKSHNPCGHPFVTIEREARQWVKICDLCGNREVGQLVLPRLSNSSVPMPKG